MPPNRREPIQVGIAKVLLSPLTAFLQKVDDWMFFANIDAGTPGQVGVLEFVLQTYVSPYIIVTTANGVVYDYRILIPEGTTSEQIGLIKDYADRWKVGGKRYQVTEAIDWAENVNPGAGLEWEPYPSIVASGSGYVIKWGMSRVGNYSTKVTNVTTGNIYVFGNIQYTGADQSVTVDHPGPYTVEVVDLVAEISAVPPTESANKPAWVNRVAITMDVDSHQSTFYLDATVPTQMNITRPGQQPSGIDHNNVPWNENTWQVGDTSYPQDGYGRLFRYNPASLGVDGLQPNTLYTIKLRRSSNLLDVFVFNYTTPASSVLALTEIELEEEDPYENLPACELGPTISSVIGATQTRIEYRSHAVNVFINDQRLLNSSNVEVVRVSTVIATESGGVITPVFPIGNQPHFTFPSIPPGVYTFQIRGGSCSSAWSPPVTITITEDGAPPEAAEGVWVGCRETTVAGKKFVWVPSQNANIEITGAGKVKLVSVSTKPAMEGGATCNRFIYDENYTELPSGYLSDLISGTGISFGNATGDVEYGHYMYYIRYCTATTYAQIEADVGMYENDMSKCALFEIVKFSVEPA